MTEPVYGYVPISKQEKQEDGSLIIEGVATDSSIDRDYQIADPAWLDTAMPEWFREGGNIREQHDGKRAAGVALTYQKLDGGKHWLRSHIVDPVTVKKIEAGVRRGYSFGAKNGRVTIDKAAAGGRIVGGKIFEVSVVDRPSNPGTVFTIAKADSNGDLQVVDVPALEETTKADEPSFTPSQFAELLKSLGKVPVPVVDEIPAEKSDAEKLIEQLTPLIIVAKADESADINNAQEAISCIARLIIRDAESLAQGNLNEIYDIRTLTDAACALQWFVCYEQTEIAMADETNTDDVVPDAVTKTDEAPVVAEPIPETPEVAVEPLNKGDDSEETLTKSDITALLEDAITKAVKPYQDELEIVKAEMTKVLETPRPGGPARTRTTNQTAVSAKADSLHREIDLCQRSIAVTGGDMQKGYRERLVVAEAELLKLDGNA